MQGRVRATIVLAAAAAFVGCDPKTALLEAVDPDIIDPSSVESAAGAVAVRNGALARLRAATADDESSWLFGGLLVDEWATSSTFVQNDETDQRQTKLDNGTVQGQLRALYRVRTSANQAIKLLTQYRPTPASDIAEMYFARGFAELQLASDFCNGIPLTDGAGDEIKYGPGLTVKEVFTVAVASFDSAISIASATDNASVTINRAARIGKARALLYGRTHVQTEDIQALALPVLRHRILTNFTAASEGVTTDKVIDRILRDTPSKEGELTRDERFKKIFAS